MIDWQNGYEARLSDRTLLADTYIKVTPVPTPSEGRLILEDNSASNYEVIHYTSKDANGVYTTAGGARNEDGNSNGIHPKDARVRMNIVAQDLQKMRDDVATVVSTYSTATVASITSGATITPSTNIYSITAQAVGATFAVPSGTATDGKVLVIRLKDNGTTQTVAWNAIYTNVSGLDMLTATIASKWHIICCMYSTAAVKWQIVSISSEL